MQALQAIARSYAKSSWCVFRVAFPLMILAAVLGVSVIELLPQRALVAEATIGGIILVALVGAFLPVPMGQDVAITYIVMAKGMLLPYVVTILCTLGIVSVFSLSVIGRTPPSQFSAPSPASSSAP
jgi:hypothetical protein